MKKLLAAAGLGAAVALGSLAGAGTASADAYGFVDDIHAYGLINVYGDNWLLDQGLTVCQNLDVGATPHYAANNLWAANPRMTAYDTGAFVAIAINDLCRWQLGQPFDGWGSSGGSTLA